MSHIGRIWPAVSFPGQFNYEDNISQLLGAAVFLAISRGFGAVSEFELQFAATNEAAYSAQRVVLIFILLMRVITWTVATGEPNPGPEAIVWNCIVLPDLVEELVYRGI